MARRFRNTARLSVCLTLPVVVRVDAEIDPDDGMVSRVTLLDVESADLVLDELLDDDRLALDEQAQSELGWRDECSQCRRGPYLCDAPDTGPAGRILCFIPKDYEDSQP